MEAPICRASAPSRPGKRPGAAGMTPTVVRVAVFLFALLAASAVTAADHASSYRIGVLAYKGKDAAMRRWGSHATYLTRKLAPLRFEVVPLSYQGDELRRAVMAHDVDFVITNPGQYTELEIGGYVSRLATRHMAGRLGSINQFGGVAVCRAERSDINSYADLAGATVLIPSRSSLGGWQVHLREALDQGVDLRRDATIIELKNHKKVVFAVLNGEGDAGFVRSDLIEEMERAGEVEPGSLKIINKRRVPGYPFILSTRLYPEWPIAVVTGTPPTVAEQVLRALFDMRPDDKAALDAGISGWTIPGHYSKVQALFREAGIGPYAPNPPTLKVVIYKYRTEILAAVALFAALVLHGLVTRRANRRLQREIAERGRVERELREMNQRLTLAADSAGFGVWDYDIARDHLYCDDAVLRLFGLERRAFTGRAADWERIVHPEDLEMAKKRLGRALKGKVAEAVYRVVQPAGRVRHVKTTAGAVSNAAGEIVRLTGIHVDITDSVEQEEKQRRMEMNVQQLQKYQSLNSMAAGIAHNFNNILAAVIGNLELALMGIEERRDVKKHVEAAADASQRAARLSTMMLQFVGQVKIERVRFDVGELLREMTAVLAPQISSRIELCCVGGEEMAVRGDLGMVRQVVANLVMNAAEAIGDDRGVIRLLHGRRFFSEDELRQPHLQASLPAGEYVYVTVEDNGAGMDKDVLRRAFDPFFTTKFTGRGMGLSTVLGIMRTHKGTIVIDSSPGAGTSATVLFPAPPDDAAPEEPAAAPEGELEPLSGTVLVVDDEPMLRELAEAALRQSGLEVLLAADGLEGVAVFKEHGRDIVLVVLDIAMPGLDGLEVLRRIRRERPAVPVLLTTGFAVDRIADQLTSLGENVELLQKPFGLRGLRRKVREMLHGLRTVLD